MDSPPPCPPRGDPAALPQDAAEPAAGPSFVGWSKRTREARWFLPHFAIERPDRPADDERTDRYHRRTLTTTTAWKLRGSSDWLEYKYRVTDPFVARVRGVTGVLETFHKVRFRPHGTLAGPWLSVHKQRWRSARSELTLISLGGAKFWTFAVSGLTADDADDAERWWSAARRWGHPGSFAAWLSAHLLVERTSLGIGRALVGPAEARHG